MRLRKLADREAMVRAVLAFEETALAADAAAELGIHRSTFIRIRMGQMWCEVLPELERLKPEQTTRACPACVHWDQPKKAAETNPCGIKIPECKSQGPGWARMCSAYMVAGGTTAPAQNEEPSGGNTVAGSGS
jgi:hypothetical protein